MEDNNFLENIDFSENFLTQDQIKCELLLPTQCDSSVDSNETSVKHTTTRNCLSKIVQNPYTNGNKYLSPARVHFRAREPGEPGPYQAPFVFTQILTIL